jgi:hypothetical protein
MLHMLKYVASETLFPKQGLHVCIQGGIWSGVKQPAAMNSLNQVGLGAAVHICLVLQRCHAHQRSVWQC